MIADPSAYNLLRERLMIGENPPVVPPRNQPLDEIIGQTFGCLDKGFVRLVDYMGTEAAVVQAARVSYGAGTKSVRDDAQLLRFLYEHEHTTPFEMVEFKFHLRMPMDAWRQGVRQRTASVNEYSTRYSEAIDDRQETPSTDWRLQSTANKQGSGEGQLVWPADYAERKADAYDTVSSTYLGKLPIVEVYGSAGEYLSSREAELHELAAEIYQERLLFGVAKEQARKDLPLSTYTELYWKIDLHNLLKFLAKRQHPTAQLEIRDYANVMGAIVELGFPHIWQAHLDFDHHKNAIKVSAPEIEFIKQLMDLEDTYGEETTPYVALQEARAKWLGEVMAGLGKRGASEFVGKIERMGIKQWN